MDRIFWIQFSKLSEVLMKQFAGKDDLEEDFLVILFELSYMVNMGPCSAFDIFPKIRNLNVSPSHILPWFVNIMCDFENSISCDILKRLVEDYLLTLSSIVLQN